MKPSHKCSRCKSSMHLTGRTRTRRGFGPFGWRYGFVWSCQCGHQCWTQETKREWDKQTKADQKPLIGI